MTLNPYAVKMIVLGSGERLPVLIALASGEPLFEPYVYVLSQIRANNRASNTIELLSSIIVLQLFLGSSQLDGIGGIEKEVSWSWRACLVLKASCQLSVEIKHFNHT